MNVPDDVRKCVVFLGYKMPGEAHRLAGSGFFVSRLVGLDDPQFLSQKTKGFTYLVTAKHVIDGIRDMGLDKVWVRANFTDGQARWDESDISEWIYHPDFSDPVDVAVRRVTLRSDLDHLSFHMAATATEEIIRQASIGPGDEVFMVGLFSEHPGVARNIPVMRFGNIAAMPEEPVDVRRYGQMDAYLIEARSMGGLSGSPVFVHIPVGRSVPLLRDKQIYFTGTTFFLLGVMHGHWDTMLTPQGIVNTTDRDRQRVNMGIAIVVPAVKMLETIEQPLIRKDEDRIVRSEARGAFPSSDNVP